MMTIQHSLSSDIIDVKENVQYDMKKTENTNTVVETMTAHIQTLTNSKCKALDNYNIVEDTAIREENADDKYLHVFRHDTDSSLNVLQCFYKHNKRQVYVLANALQFKDFKTDVENELAHKTRIRYKVDYDKFTQFIESILTYDSTDRQTKQSTVAKQDKTQTDKKQKATKQSKAKSKAQ